ncbi:hypothetical protein NC652_013605 [Populus alba x Populus x berolinensis]|nr:hypothetical protein NC652_013605 [Populus alba x Populus x berolinensis]
MRSSMKLTFLLLITFWSHLTFKMNHRFSASFKNYAGLTRNWPEKRSFEYYATLAHRNQMLRGRRLSDVVSALLQAFEDVLHLATEDGARENLLKTTSHLEMKDIAALPWSIWAGHGEDFCSWCLIEGGIDSRFLIADSFSICFGHGGTGSDSIQCEPDPPKL